MNRLKIAVFVALLVALVVPVSALAQDGASSRRRPPPGVRSDPVYAPHIVAIEKGWLEEAGFTEIETATFTSGAAAGEALIAGEIDLWTPGTVPPISMRHNGMPDVIVATGTPAYVEKFVARTDAGD